MQLPDSKSLAAFLSALLFIVMRWRWDYVVALYRNPKKAAKFLLIWLFLILLVLRVFWQLKPSYFG